MSGNPNMGKYGFGRPNTELMDYIIEGKNNRVPELVKAYKFFPEIQEYEKTRVNKYGLTAEEVDFVQQAFPPDRGGRKRKSRRHRKNKLHKKRYTRRH